MRIGKLVSQQIRDMVPVFQAGIVAACAIKIGKLAINIPGNRSKGILIVCVGVVACCGLKILSATAKGIYNINKNCKPRNYALSGRKVVALETKPEVPGGIKVQDKEKAIE